MTGNPSDRSLWSGLVRRLREDVARVAGEAVRRAVRTLLGGDPTRQDPVPAETLPESEPPGVPQQPAWRRVVSAIRRALGWWVRWRVSRPFLAASVTALGAGLAAAPAGIPTALVTSACLGLAVLAGCLLVQRPANLA